MKIHAIQTGTVAIKTRQVEGYGHGARHRLNMGCTTSRTPRSSSHPPPDRRRHPDGLVVAHDPASASRLAERRTVAAAPLEAAA